MEIFAGICLLIQSMWDIRTKELPLWISAVLGCCGFVYSLCTQRMGWEMVYALLPGLFCLFLGFVTRQAVGYGDGILLCALGVFYTCEELMQICTIAIVAAGFAGLILLVVFQKSGKYEIPFVPFLFLGWCICFGMDFIGV